MDVYESLRIILDAHPSGAPPSKAFDEILRTLFTPEEAELALHMSFSPRPLHEIAASAAIPEDEAEFLLESMADKAVIFSREKDGVASYGLLPTVPGLFEFPLMRGGGAPVHERLGKLWTKYRRDGLAASFAGNPTPVARVVPIRHAIDNTLHIHPYEEVANLIERADYIALGRCACRVSTRACHAPLDTCLFFDAPARFLVERRYARRIEKEEAKRVLDRSEDAGLVHTSSNTADRASFICNCCPCCCIILTCRTRLNLADGFATSGFQASVESDKCSGCRLCADERCPVAAIEMKDDCAAVDPGKCIGCGLCATACPTGAVTLVRRTNAPGVPATSHELATTVLKEKDKLDRFLKVAKK